MNDMVYPSCFESRTSILSTSSRSFSFLSPGVFPLGFNYYFFLQNVLIAPWFIVRLSMWRMLLSKLYRVSLYNEISLPQHFSWVSDQYKELISKYMYYNMFMEICELPCKKKLILNITTKRLGLFICPQCLG